MPSGSKKRKAAKKKKGKGINTSTNPQGINELKSQDEKGSDGGSPSFRDHGDDHDHPFNEGKQEVSEPSAAQPSAADDAKSAEVVPSDVKIVEAEGGKQDVASERDLRESFESEGVVLVEPAKESDYRNGGNSGDCLNDETVHESAKDEPENSVKEAVTFDDLVKSIDSSHAKMTSIAENAPVGDTGNSVLESPVDPVRAADSISDVTGSDSGSALPEKSVASQVGPIDPVRAVDSISEVTGGDSGSALPEKSVASQVGPFDPVIAVDSKSEVTGSDSGSALPEKSVASQVGPIDPVRAVDSISEVTGSDSGSALPEKSVASQVVPIDLAVKKNGDKVHPFTDDTEHVKDSYTAESSENQPLVASAPRVVQKTSWLNCCGLFEVLTGSNR